MANGTYGALGSKYGLLPFRIIAESTTAIGRRDNKRVQAIAKELFAAKNGYPGPPLIVGGDTDSVFLAFDALVAHIPDRDERLRTVFEYGKLLEEAVNAQMRAPSKIELEKVYSPQVLFKKKRYIGLKYTSPDKKPTPDKRGIECQRRGVVGLVSEMVADVSDSMLYTGDIVEGAAYIRDKVDDIMNDRVPLSKYVSTPVLRKTKLEYSEPLTPAQVRDARLVIGSTSVKPELSYEEWDRLIRAGPKHIPRLIAKGSEQGHVAVAWKKRKADPANCPVAGEQVFTAYPKIYQRVP